MNETEKFKNFQPKECSCGVQILYATYKGETPQPCEELIGVRESQIRDQHQIIVELKKNG